MKRNCPNQCCLDNGKGVKSKPIGQYYRRSDSKWIKRWQCQICRKTFSSATFSACIHQNKRRLNKRIRDELTSGVSQRRIALKLGIDRKTVARKLRFLAQQAKQSQEDYLQSMQKVSVVQFDDMETFEQTKCKPVSIVMAIEPSSRKILSIAVSQMPCTGKLAEKAQKRYGKRVDERSQGWNRLFATLQDVVQDEAIFSSDQNPHYPRYVKKYFPQATHYQFKGRKPAAYGQGEVKQGKFDPLFCINHTCAMAHDNIKTMVRKTWCTTKKMSALEDRLTVYMNYHNQVLTT